MESNLYRTSTLGIHISKLITNSKPNYAKILTQILPCKLLAKKLSNVFKVKPSSVYSKAIRKPCRFIHYNNSISKNKSRAIVGLVQR